MPKTSFWSLVRLLVILNVILKIWMLLSMQGRNLKMQFQYHNLRIFSSFLISFFLFVALSMISESSSFKAQLVRFQQFKIDVLEAFLVWDQSFHRQDVHNDFLQVQIDKIEVLIDHYLDKFDVPIVVTEFSLSLGLSQFFLKVYLEFLDLAYELLLIFANQEYHLGFIPKIGYGMGVQNLGLGTDLLIEMVEFFESVDLELHLNELREVIFMTAKQVLRVV